MKKLSLTLICWFILVGNFAIAKEITLGYVNFPPYEFSENGQPAGILVDIVKSAFKEAGIPLKLEFLPFKRAYKDTLEGRIDGLFNFYKNEERMPLFDYTRPVIKNSLVFFVRKDSKVKFDKLEDLKGLRIGAMIGYTYGLEFDKTTLFEIDRVSSHETNFKKLVYGRIHAYPCDKLVGIYVARKEKLMSECMILPKPLKVMDGHIGFKKGKHPDVVEKINNVVKKKQESGKINKIILNWIIYNNYKSYK
ncbi:MAG: transporter substrate-binding domain-containing protein [Desulfobacterales bacterium]|nr:transporter substrate-binding domain-containing protein [Desulfobacterales bacterium]